MKSLSKIFLRERTFLGALAFFFLLRVTYALTRNLFLSGPDAPNYAKAPLDFVKFGFWSNHIEGAPYYPIGYPVVLWPLAQIGGTKWVMLAQVLQVFLSICTVYFVFKTSQIFMRTELALIVGFFFLFSPAFTPMSGEAMYESVLMFAFYLYLYLILKSQNDLRNHFVLIAAGVMAGVAAVIHPRVIPWILAIQIILLGRIGYRRCAVFFGFFLSPVVLFLIRNKLAHNVWALSTAGDSWMNDIRSAKFGLIFKRGIWNAVHFWSPYSGDAKRGTWLHNFTFYHEIKKITHSTTFVIVLATIFALISIAAWLFGAFLLIKSKNLIGSIVLCVPLLAWITDFLTSGDSRHRLVVMPLLLIGQVSAFSWLQRRYVKNSGYSKAIVV